MSANDLVLAGEAGLDVLRVLASEARMQILELLSNASLNVGEISRALQMPQPTATMHIKRLERAGLIRTEIKPATQGFQKICHRVYDRIVLNLPMPEVLTDPDIVEVDMPIGLYRDAVVEPPCGLVTESEPLEPRDRAETFLDPHHVYAQQIWFGSGHLEYLVPNRLPPQADATCFELCCEIAPLSEADATDVAVVVNGVALGVFRLSRAAVGGRVPPVPDGPGRVPQHGFLKHWTTNRSGSFVDGFQISEVGIDQLQIGHRPTSVRIQCQGPGLCLFGAKRGTYPLSLVMRLQFARGGP